MVVDCWLLFVVWGLSCCVCWLGDWLLVIGCWCSIVRRWSLVGGRCLVVVVCLLLVCCLLVVVWLLLVACLLLSVNYWLLCGGCSLLVVWMLFWGCGL